MTKWALNMLEIACVCRTEGRQRGKNVVFNKSKPEAKNRVWAITILISFCCVIIRVLIMDNDQWSSSSAGKEDILEWVGPSSRSWPSLEFLQLLMDQLPATLLRCHHYSLHHHHHHDRNFPVSTILTTFQKSRFWRLKGKVLAKVLLKLKLSHSGIILWLFSCPTRFLGLVIQPAREAHGPEGPARWEGSFWWIWK